MFLCVDLGYLVNLLTRSCSVLAPPELHHPSGGHELSIVPLLSFLERGYVLPLPWEGASKCPLQSLLASEVTKRFNFILATAASTMAAKGKSYILFKPEEEVVELNVCMVVLVPIF
jgi:hypothetical protein